MSYLLMHNRKSRSKSIHTIHIRRMMEAVPNSLDTTQDEALSTCFLV